MLKGNGKTATNIISAKDAGIAGSLKGVGTGKATFTMTALRHGDKINIGSKGYTIGITVGSSVAEAFKKDVAENLVKLNDKVVINGTEYTVKAQDSTIDPTQLSAKTIANIIKDGDTVIIGTQTYKSMIDEDNDGVGDNDASVISAKKAYELIQD